MNSQESASSEVSQSNKKEEDTSPPSSQSKGILKDSQSQSQRSKSENVSFSLTEGELGRDGKVPERENKPSPAPKPRRSLSRRPRIKKNPDGTKEKLLSSYDLHVLREEKIAEGNKVLFDKEDYSDFSQFKRDSSPISSTPKRRRETSPEPEKENIKPTPPTPLKTRETPTKETTSPEPENNTPTLPTPTAPGNTSSSSDSDISVVFVGESGAENPIFSPAQVLELNYGAVNMGITLTKGAKSILQSRLDRAKSKGQRIPPGRPAKSLNTAMDGNCLFHALSNAFTGAEKHHEMVRSMICSFIRNPRNYDLLHGHLGTRQDSKRHDCYLTGAEYIEKKRMDHPRVWGTDVEILAAASLTGVDICVHVERQLKNGPQYQAWETFAARSNTKSKNAVFLRNVDAHYEPIYDV